MKLAFAICLLALFASTMAADIQSTGQVKLLFVESLCTHFGPHPRPIYDHNTRFHVEVQNIADDKQVAIHWKNPQTGVWEDLPLSWRSTGAINPDDNTKSTDVFSGELYMDTIDTRNSANMSVEFEVKYTVAGNTYWQKNTTGRNFLINDDIGPILANGLKIYAADHQPRITLPYLDTTTQEPTSFLVYLKSKNARGKAINAVTIRYTDNEWETQNDVRCTLASYYDIHSQAKSPNAAGYEAWRCSVPLTVGATTLEYAASVIYHGSLVEIWDDNFGENYKTALVWERV